MKAAKNGESTSICWLFLMGDDHCEKWIGVNLVWVKNVDSSWGARHVGQGIFHIKSSIRRNQEG
jgi:hypothetical protein